jgi:hypothetical protein
MSTAPRDRAPQAGNRTSDAAAHEHAAPPRAHHPLRRAQPALVLLPRTAIWIANLPPAARPNALAARFARIANLLCALWDDPPVCRKYFDDLLHDRRGGRQGFPPEVRQELGLLHTYFEHATRPVGDVLEWDTTGLELAWTGSSKTSWDWVA